MREQGRGSRDAGAGRGRVRGPGAFEIIYFDLL